MVYHNVCLFLVLDEVRYGTVTVEHLASVDRKIRTRYEKEVILAKAKINEDFRYTGLVIK